MGANIYKNKKPLIFFLLPAFLFLAVYLYYPFFRNILTSFQAVKSLGVPGKAFNDPWYSNYARLFSDPNLLVSLKNTVIMIIATIVGQVGIALILALMVDNIRVGAKALRTMYFFPIVISSTALGLLFNLIFLKDKGMVNQLIEWITGNPTVFDWKQEGIAIFTMMLPVVWQYVGFYFVILITGLNNISAELYEAASIDGAKKMQQIRYITLPLMHNVICTCVILAVTGALKVFDLPWVMFPKGLPLKSTFLTGTYMYYQTNEVKDVDYGATLAILIVILGVVLSQVVNRIFKEREDI